MRLLLVTGDSLHSDQALRLGAWLAQLSTKTATLLTVIRKEAQRVEALAALESAHQTYLSELAEVETKVRVGHLAAEVLHEVVEGQYDLLVIGEEQWSARSVRLYGSLSRQLAQHAPCPILIAKGGAHSIHRILVCDSGAVLPSVLQRFEATGLPRLLAGMVHVTVLHVMSQISAAPGVEGSDLEADAAELIRERSPEGLLFEHDIELLGQYGIEPEPKVRHGFVVDEILEEARLGDYDLVVIGAHRGAGWQRLLLDDIARDLTEHCDRPILALR